MFVPRSVRVKFMTLIQVFSPKTSVSLCQCHSNSTAYTLLWSWGQKGEGWEPSKKKSIPLSEIGAHWIKNFFEFFVLKGLRFLLLNSGNVDPKDPFCLLQCKVPHRTSTPALGLTQPHIQWARKVLSPGAWSWPFHVVARYKMDVCDRTCLYAFV